MRLSLSNLILTAFLLLASSTFASTLPTNKNEFCMRFDDETALSSLSIETNNLMSFKNQGGLFNGGVCWWHSRFQRNIFYLSILRPDLNHPSLKEAKVLIKEIRDGKKIITIPGFSSFSDFTETYKKEIVSELEAWQLYDGVVLGSWIDGLKGDTKVKPEVLSGMMDTLYSYVEVDKKIAYQKLQIKGITSHAWLIVGMKKMPAGYEIGLIDSNNPRMCENYSYKIGDESFFEKSYGNFVPYLEFTREEKRISDIAKVFCGKSSSSNLRPERWDEEYKEDLKEALSIF